MTSSLHCGGGERPSPVATALYPPAAVSGTATVALFLRRNMRPAMPMAAARGTCEIARSMVHHESGG